jgi:hypothetical protein
MKPTPETLLSLESYARQRAQIRASIIPHRRTRSLQLGEHMTLQFEDDATIRYQIQEMLRIEKIFEADAIQDEIEAYAPLIPDGSNWKATMLLEYPEVEQRRRELARLVGIEDHMYVDVDGCPRTPALADEDLDRETADKTSSVHFLRFEFAAPTIAAMRAGAAVHVGCDHPHYTARAAVTAATRDALLRGFAAT